MIILGIDPGLATTGYGLIKLEGRKFIYLGHGIINTRAHTDTAERLRLLAIGIKKLAKTYQPSQAAVEQLFMYKNVKTAILVGQARGVILLTLAQSRIAVVEFTPLQIKQALTGYGRADKQQMQRMVKIVLELDFIPKPDDAADALATAICCCQTNHHLIKLK